jgi:hypothetical protein
MLVFYYNNNNHHNNIQTFINQPPGMHTIFDQVQADYLIISIIESIFSLGTVAISNIFNMVNETLARVISLTVFSFVVANMIHLCSACITRLASICLIGFIEELNG